jgi:hypothetical protein
MEEIARNAGVVRRDQVEPAGCNRTVRIRQISLLVPLRLPEQFRTGNAFEREMSISGTSVVIL